MSDATKHELAFSTAKAESVNAGRRLNLGLGLLAVIGIGLAGYMSYTDLLGTIPVCGGIGDCETVHTSAYAFIAGVPVAVLGLVSYVAVAGLVLGRQAVSGTTAYLASLGILVMVLSGTLFSAFLTYLEFFVIDAVCPWCVASALTITSMLILSAVDVVRQTRGWHPSRTDYAAERSSL